MGSVWCGTISKSLVHGGLVTMGRGRERTVPGKLSVLEKGLI